MSQLSEPYVRAAERRAYRAAERWAETDAAIALLDKAILLEDWADEVAGHDLTAVADAIGEELQEVEANLDDLRREAIFDAVNEWPEENDDYVEDHFDDMAPKVAAAIRARRLYIRDTQLVPVSRLGLGKVAA